MLFNSVEYLALLAVTFALYWSVPWQQARLWLMLLASCVFYASWEPLLLLLLLGAIGANFILTRMLPFRARTLILLAVAGNLGLLGFFKYTNFLMEVLADLSMLVGERLATRRFDIVLPLGISFFTFQLLAYAIDIHRGRLQPERSLLRFAVFISFFPQLIAGPICRGSQFLVQLHAPTTLTLGRFSQGLLMLAIGLLLKAGIADNLAPYVDSVYDAESAPESTAAALATLAFGVQILCDFWGYSTMALGSAHLFGLSIPSNFNLPYVATTMQSFWRRWHITLSFWLRDYLYVPLGGNRNGRVRTYFNLMVVMVLGGLWHGASYNFLIWGGMHGGGLALERLLLRRLPAPSGWLRFPVRLLGWCWVMLIAFTAWVFFRASDLSKAIEVIHAGVRMDRYQWLTEAQWQPAMLLIAFALLMVPLHALNNAGRNLDFYAPGHSDDRLAPPEPGAWALREGMLVLPDSVRLVLAFWMACAAIVLGSGDVVPFIYFQF